MTGESDMAILRIYYHICQFIGAILFTKYMYPTYH